MPTGRSQGEDDYKWCKLEVRQKVFFVSDGNTQKLELINTSAP